jgi:hypothetical protein
MAYEKNDRLWITVYHIDSSLLTSAWMYHSKVSLPLYPIRLIFTIPVVKSPRFHLRIIEGEVRRIMRVRAWLSGIFLNIRNGCLFFVKQSCST